MSQIDQAAKQPAIPLIQGANFTFSGAKQKLIATWLAKIAMVGDAIEREQSMVPPIQREFMRLNFKPPLEWQVWVGSYGGEEWHHLKIHQMRGRLKLPLPVYRAGTFVNASLVGMGTLLAIILGHDVPDLTLDMGDYSKILTRIWPVSDEFVWPTPNLLSDEDAAELSNIINVLRLV